MGLKMITVVLPALFLLRGSNGATTRDDPEGDTCSLEKYEGGDGTVDISKCNQTFSQFFRFCLKDSVIVNRYIFMSDISNSDKNHLLLKNDEVF